MKRLYYAVCNTKMGWVGILGSPGGLLRITLPQSSSQEARKKLGNIEEAIPSDRFAGLVARLEAYFNGAGAEFSDPLDLSEATEFQRQVWNATRRIPCGETRSYTWIAEQINKPEAYRAVGQALGKNPLPIIIPCHRVLSADGTLGGFTGGLKMKRRLLQLEALKEVVVRQPV